jgi:thiol peroxidase
MIERPNAVTFKGNPMTLVGPVMKVGDIAPAFRLTGGGLSDVDSTSFAGKIIVLSVVPSIDTPVCAIQTKRFNKEASALSKDVAIVTASMDLPFAQGRFCAAEGIDQVVLGSDYKYRNLGETYGVLVKELALLARAVFVIGRDGTIVHVEYVSEIADEPDYEAALVAVRKAL